MAWFREVSGNAIQLSVYKASAVTRPVLSSRRVHVVSVREESVWQMGRSGFVLLLFVELRSQVELTLGPPHLGILLRQASLLVAKWLPPALSLSPTRGSRSLSPSRFQQRRGMESLGFCFG